MARTAGLVFALLLAGCVTPVGNPTGTPIAMGTVTAPAPPRQGDRFDYVIRNGYNGETLGRLEYRIDSVASANYAASVNTGAAASSFPGKALLALDGNWIRHALTNHNQFTEYEFNPPYPDHAFPLSLQSAWSQRVNARNAATGRVQSVRVDGNVLGAERISTPAGQFDTIKIARKVYVGDFDAFLSETQISETEWYSPQLGRAVRLERNSEWLDQSRGASGSMFNSNQLIRGDWLVYELAAAPAR